MLLVVLPAEEWSPLVDCEPSSLRGEFPFLPEPRLAERLKRTGFDPTRRLWCEYDERTQSLTFRQETRSRQTIVDRHVDSRVGGRSREVGTSS